jgi:UDP-3-O-[3-hydroxymyristoyl] glucosamine N-acyltransferase LpxD
VDRAARVAASASVAPDAAVGPHVFVGERARVGARTVLHPGVYLGDDVVVGDDCVLYPNVVVRERITLGSRVIIHAGSVLGSDGFGYRWDGSKHAKVPQIGTVVVEDDVEIGSCVCIDRAKFAATKIGRGTKIDNLVQIAHNVQVGPHCIIVASVGVAGSAKLGAGVVLGGRWPSATIVTIGDGAWSPPPAGIHEDVPPKSFMSGTPALPHRRACARGRDAPHCRTGRAGEEASGGCRGAEEKLGGVSGREIGNPSIESETNIQSTGQISTTPEGSPSICAFLWSLICFGFSCLGIRILATYS